jgi:hypothetical protein
VSGLICWRSGIVTSSSGTQPRSRNEATRRLRPVMRFESPA